MIAIISGIKIQASGKTVIGLIRGQKSLSNRQYHLLQCLQTLDGGKLLKLATIDLLDSSTSKELVLYIYLVASSAALCFRPVRPSVCSQYNF